MNDLNSGHDVFISYSSEGNDKLIADAVCAKLEEQKIKCWIAPRDVIPGRHYGGAIVEAITDSRIFVLVFSNHANRSPQVLIEVERAVSKGVPVIPFRIEDVTPSKDMEYFLSATHWLEAITPPIEKHIQRLAVTIRTFLGLQDLPDDDTTDESMRAIVQKAPLKETPTAPLTKTPKAPLAETPKAPLAEQAPAIDEEDIDYETDLMAWSEREVYSDKRRLMILRLLAVLLPVLYLIVIVAGVITAPPEGASPDEGSAMEAVLMISGLLLSAASIAIAFLLSRKLGFSRSMQILFAALAFLVCTIPLIVLLFLKPAPRDLISHYDKLEKDYRRMPDGPAQKSLALVLARRAFIGFQIDKKRDAYVFAAEALTIANKHGMANLDMQLSDLLKLMGRAA